MNTAVQVGWGMWLVGAVLAGAGAIGALQPGDSSPPEAPAFLHVCTDARFERQSVADAFSASEPAYRRCLIEPGRVHIAFVTRPDGSAPWIIVRDQTDATVAACIAEVSCERRYDLPDGRTGIGIVEALRP